MIKLAKIIKVRAGAKIDPKDHFALFDREGLAKSLKRVDPIRVRTGETDEDFMNNCYSVVLEVKVYRIPRFINPLRGRRRGKTKTA